MRGDKKQADNISADIAMDAYWEAAKKGT